MAMNRMSDRLSWITCRVNNCNLHDMGSWFCFVTRINILDDLFNIFDDLIHIIR